MDKIEDMWAVLSDGQSYLQLDAEGGEQPRMILLVQGEDAIDALQEFLDENFGHGEEV